MPQRTLSFFPKDKGGIMIRPFRKDDTDEVAALWLTVNLECHHFIPADHFYTYYDTLKEVLPQEEVYVMEENGLICGFIGMGGNYIEGLFVLPAYRGKGIGKRCWSSAEKDTGRYRSVSTKKMRMPLLFIQRRAFEKIR